MKTFLFVLALIGLTSKAFSAMPHNEPCLAFASGVNFNSTNDTALVFRASKYIIRRVVVCNASTSLSVAVGGIYTAASKGGTPVIAATQVYSTLTGSTKFLDMTLAAILTTDVRTETTLYFSLTTAQGGAATADIFVFGDALEY